MRSLMISSEFEIDLSWTLVSMYTKMSLCSLGFWMSTNCSPQWLLNLYVYACTDVSMCAESNSLCSWVYVASVHCGLRGVVCVSAQVQLLLSPVAVISELSWEALLAACSSCGLFNPNYIPIIKMLIHTVKGAIKRVIKKALFHQSTWMKSLTIAGPLLIFTVSIMPEV